MMNTLKITNEEGTVFEYSIEDQYLVINVTKNGKTNIYKAYKKSRIKEGKLHVCRADGTWVDMPVFEAEKVNQFKDSRIKHTFSKISDLRAFEEANSCGSSWVENGNICVYQYV